MVFAGYFLLPVCLGLFGSSGRKGPFLSQPLQTQKQLSLVVWKFLAPERNILLAFSFDLVLGEPLFL